jgi:hypothetical protein
MRSTTELRGLREIRTIQSVKRSSMPKSQSSSYLDLYMMKREKDRLEKETFTLEKKRRAIQNREKGWFRERLTSLQKKSGRECA